VLDAEARARPAMAVGVVGLGSGAVAAYARPGDRYRFFEIDPLVARVARDRRNFGYLTGCAKGDVAFAIGDARLTLTRSADGPFDVLLVDAFSSDSVPAHLLTVEAARLYLARVKPDGVVIFHLSSRNLDLINVTAAVARAAGAVALLQRHRQDPRLPPLWESSEDAVVMARDPAALGPFRADPRWRAADPHGVAPWSDDHVDMFGALMRRLHGDPAKDEDLAGRRTG